jgi:hypothetical protein
MIVPSGQYLPCQNDCKEQLAAKLPEGLLPLLQFQKLKVEILKPRKGLPISNLYPHQDV